MLSASSRSAPQANELGGLIDQILARAAAHYEAVLWERSERVRSWLLARGVTESTLREFGVGYAPERWQGLLEALRPLSPSASELIEAGLARPTERGRLRVHFRSRVMFPVRDGDGR